MGVGTIFMGARSRPLQNCVEQKYDFENILNVTRSPPLAAEVLFNITEFMNYLDQRIGTAAARARAPRSRLGASRLSC